MTDRENIINEIEKRIKNAEAGMGFSVFRPDTLKIIVALLKEQEAVEPIPPTDESEMWRCGNCHHQIFRCTHQRFCERCGHAVKWK